MSLNRMRIAVLPGDGIGKEVLPPATECLQLIAKERGVALETTHGAIGVEGLERFGEVLPNETVELCLESDAVLLGALGDPRYDNQPLEQRPEKALLGLRAALDTYANLRPAKYWDSLADVCPLKPEVVRGADVLFVRELRGDIYFGEPRERHTRDDGVQVAIDTMVYDQTQIRRISEIAFTVARQRKGRVVSVDKANVLENSRLWRETVDTFSRDYPDVKLEHRLVDSFAFALIKNPTEFDVVLCPNMFGDILSDEAAVFAGSLGLSPSASLGGRTDLYEPVHGSAPDLAGLDRANPIASILSVAMMLRWTFGWVDEARAIENAIKRALASGPRTIDIATKSRDICGTRAFSKRVVDELAMELSS